MMVLKEKLIGFPKEILDILDEYRKMTGTTAASYIRRATAREMIKDDLISITSIKINIDDVSKKVKEEMTE